MGTRGVCAALGIASALWISVVPVAKADDAGEAAVALDPKAKAEAALLAGLELMDAGRYSEAVVRFETALRLVPGATGALLELSRAYHRMGNCAATIPHLERYLEMKRVRGEPADPEARITLDDCKTTAAPRATVTSEPPGARVRLDDIKGKLLGETPVEAAAIPLGLHDLYVAKSGFATRKINVTGKYGELAKAHAVLTPMYPVRIKADIRGAVVKVDGYEVGRTPIVSPIPMKEGEHLFEMEKEGSPPIATIVRIFPDTREVHLSVPGVVPPPPDAEPERRVRAGLWLAVGGGAVVVAGAAVLAAVLLAKRTPLERYIDDYPEAGAVTDLRRR